HMDHQFKALTTWQQLSHGPTSLAADLHPLLSHAGRVAASCISIAAHLSADRRRGSVDQAGNPAQAEALGMTNLNGGTLFNAEFGIRHRAAPYRKGQVLHSVFAAAQPICHTPSGNRKSLSQSSRTFTRRIAGSYPISSPYGGYQVWGEFTGSLLPNYPDNSIKARYPFLTGYGHWQTAAIGQERAFRKSDVA
ncbi:hypothetical protein SAMN05216586_1181, partial [Halopseudomonas aestusnigri]